MRFLMLVTVALGLACGMDPEQPPVACGRLGDLSVSVGQDTSVVACFSDENIGGLTYDVLSSVPAVVAVGVGPDGLVSLSGLSVGESEVTVVAKNLKGLSADVRFKVTVPNRNPELCGDPLLPLVFTLADTLRVPFCFEDLDGHPMEYSATSSDPSVRVSVDRSDLIVQGLTVGSSVISLSAEDSEGGKTAVELSATVANRTPIVCEALPETLEVFLEVERQATAPVCIEDPDGHPLADSVLSSTEHARAELSSDRSQMSFTGVSPGEAVVRYWATDPFGAIAETSTRFSVVGNRPPEVCLEMPESSAALLGQSRQIPVCIEDPDGQMLVDSVSLSNGNITVELSQARDALIVTGVQTGTTRVRYWATDPFGETAETQGDVRVLGGGDIFIDEFTDTLGGWTHQPDRNVDAEYNVGDFEIRDGVLRTWVLPGTDGWGGASKRLDDTENWTVEIRLRSNSKSVFADATMVEIFDANSTLSYHILVDPSRNGYQRIVLWVYDSTTDNWLDQFDGQAETEVPDDEWFDVTVSVVRGWLSVAWNGNEFHRIEDSGGVISTIDRIDLNAVGHDESEPAEFDRIRVTGSSGVGAEVGAETRAVSRFVRARGEGK